MLIPTQVSDGKQTPVSDVEDPMPSYNRNFELNREELDLIEIALRERTSKLVDAKRDAGDDSSAPEFDKPIREGQALLGRLHNQKVFYRPKKTVYVGG